MSREYSMRYALEQKRRQELFNARVREKTEPFYHRYCEKYEELLMSGVEQYIPEDMLMLKNDLSRLGELLSSNPAEAREVSFTIGSYINTLNEKARNVSHQLAREERIRIRREELKMVEAASRDNRSDALDKYYNIVGNMTDTFSIGFVWDYLDDLRTDIDKGKVPAAAVKARVYEIISKGEQRAAEWQAAEEERKKQAVLEQINSLDKEVSGEELTKSDKQQSLVERIRELKKLAESENASRIEVNEQIKAITEEIDEEVISEQTRREAVKAVFKELKSQEFTVDAPQLITEGDGSYVLIRARKPSGKRAECRIDLHGGLTYKFDSYEGMTCLKDIEKFNEDLDKVYSIKLSDERVLWSNPDRLSADSVSNPDSKGGGSNG